LHLQHRHPGEDSHRGAEGREERQARDEEGGHRAIRSKSRKTIPARPMRERSGRSTQRSRSRSASPAPSSEGGRTLPLTVVPSFERSLMRKAPPSTRRRRACSRETSSEVSRRRSTQTSGASRPMTTSSLVTQNSLAPESSL